MSKEVVVKKNEIANWSKDKWTEIKKMFVPNGVSDLETQMFLELAKAYELNPFKREIWIIPFKTKYGTKAQVFAGRDGFLSIAHRTGQFSGMETDFGYDKQGKLMWAETVVWNKSCEHPIKHKAYLKEYTTGMNLWASKPHVMIQKVSESSALRRAFNINGLYSPEEFGDSDNTPDNTVNETKTEQRQIEPEKKKEKSEEALYNEAMKYIESATTLDRIATAKKRVNEIEWNEEPARFGFLNDVIIKQIEKIVQPLAYTDKLKQKIEYILEVYTWEDNHKKTIAQILIDKAD